MKNKKHIILFMFALLSLCLVMAGCSSNSGKSEKAIQEDLIEWQIPSEAFSTGFQQITDFEILKRQTDPDNKTDLVYVTVTADSETGTFVRSYKLTYSLYNDGWILDDYEDYSEGKYETHAKALPSDQEIDNLFTSYNNSHTNQYIDWSIAARNEDLENGYAVYTVVATYECFSAYATATETYIIPFYFSDWGSWMEYGEYEYDNESYSIDWSNLDQEAAIESDENYLVFEAIDPDGTITVSYYAHGINEDYSDTLVFSLDEISMPSSGEIGGQTPELFHWSSGYDARPNLKIYEGISTPVVTLDVDFDHRVSGNLE